MVIVTFRPGPISTTLNRPPQERFALDQPGAAQASQAGKLEARNMISRHAKRPSCSAAGATCIGRSVYFMIAVNPASMTSERRSCMSVSLLAAMIGLAAFTAIADARVQNGSDLAAEKGCMT
jgi:hypothetical protein